jgi:hypothetical protein
MGVRWPPAWELVVTGTAERALPFGKDLNPEAED